MLIPLKPLMCFSMSLLNFKNVLDITWSVYFQ